MDNYINLTTIELENELKSIEIEFNELKNAVATGLKRLGDLSNDYELIKKEIGKRSINGVH